MTMLPLSSLDDEDETSEAPVHEGFDAFNEHRLVAFPPQAWATLVDWDVLAFDGKAMHKLTIAYDAEHRFASAKEKIDGVFAGPRWIKALFPFEDEEKALALLTKEEWQRYFKLCAEDQGFRNAVASILLLKGIEALSAYVRGILALDDEDA